jgi:hypothetical protein
MPLQLQDKSDFVLELTPTIDILKSNLFNTRSLSSQSVGVFAQIQTLDPLFMSSNPQWRVKIKLLR